MSSLLKIVSRAGRANPALLANEASCRAGVSCIHTTKASFNGDRWAIPERLANIPDAENPPFFNMVEYYYHKACILAEDKMVRKNVRLGPY